MGGADSKNNPHIIKLKEFLLKPDFFICLAYNLKNKAIDTSNFPGGSLAVNEMLILSLSEEIRRPNEEDLNIYISHKTDEFYKERVEQAIQSENNIYTDVSCSSASSMKGLYYDAELIEFFTSFMCYDISMKDLLIFRDDFHSTLKSFILNSSSHHKNQDWYQYSIEMSYKGIIKKISPLIDKLIEFRNGINYNESPSEVLKNKKEELQRYTASLSNQL